MIDTICLLIPKKKLTILDMSSYGVPGWSINSKTDGYERYIKNPSKKDLESGLYFPRLTGYKRSCFSEEANVRIEFSVSKLIFLNNLEELRSQDFPRVIRILQDRLKNMGVYVEKKILERASVSSAHFSKNIQLKDGYTSNYIISEINKIDLRKSFDFARVRYINDGHSIYAHTTAHELVIYDKMADLNKDKNRAIDKDQTQYQNNLSKKLKRVGKLDEVIRFEIRLNQKRKMNQVLEIIGFKKNPNFKEIFNSEISKRVIKYYWNKLIIEKNLGIFSITLSDKDILQTMILTDNTLKPKQIIYLFGLFKLARNENGMRQLRAIISKQSHDRTWYRISKDMRSASDMIVKNRIRNWVTQISMELDTFEAYKI